MSAPANYYDYGIRTNLGQFIWHNLRFKRLEKILPGKANSILDVGCHGGLFTEKVAQSFPRAEVYGVDIDSQSIIYAQEKRPEYIFKIASAEKLPFPKDNFDLITCLEVLEHVEKPRKVLQEIKRCLKPEGVFIALVPTESCLFRLVWRFWIKYKGKVWKDKHIQIFNGKRLDNLLINEGFIIQKRKQSHLGMLLAIKAKKNTR